MPCTTEEECRREKILRDAQVAAVAAKGIGMVQRGEMTLSQVRALIDLDERYLADAEGICPELCR